VYPNAKRNGPHGVNGARVAELVAGEAEQDPAFALLSVQT